MPKSVVFLAETGKSPSLAEQTLACVRESDFVVNSPDIGFKDLEKVLAKHGNPLEQGDTIKIYDLSTLAVSTSTVLRVMLKLLKGGVSIELCGLGLTITPDRASHLFLLLEALDSHWRQIHGIKTNEGRGAKAGRKPRLTVEQLPEIRRMLSEKGANHETVAKQLGVARSTLFGFLKSQKDVLG
ncbi:recombinase family protein [Novosphingobium sp. MBES04]|uniref:recombinase family protein n=1 Tax=Novosphingobium sp. MBES04 TaxID=1206458 RepID=UPI001F5AA42F|nr:recombinase family protein [Novosphingobium sp. MBES04]